LPWIGKDGVSEVGGKVSVLLDKVEELYLSGKKILIFSQFTRFLEIIEEHISMRLLTAPIYTLTGATRDRSKPVEEFQTRAGGAIMLVSLRAGGTGITLTSADYVFLADPWWNPAVEEQAIDRVHRIGRKGDVFVYRMIAQDTVEDRVRKLQVQKRKLFNDLLGGLKDVSNHVRFIETVSDILS
jgi:SNF2 family DNA or RNA helicase